MDAYGVFVTVCLGVGIVIWVLGMWAAHDLGRGDQFRRKWHLRRK